MKLDKVPGWLEKFAFRTIEVAHRAGLVILFILMCFTVGDVILRYFFDSPIKGVFELTNFALLMVIFCSLGYTQVRKGHVTINLFVDKFSPRVQAIIDSIIFFLSLVLFSLVTWQLAIHGKRVFETGQVSGVLDLPIYPFLIVAVIGSLLFCLALLINLLSSLAGVLHHES